MARPNSSEWIYQQIFSRIESGEYPYNSFLPSEPGDLLVGGQSDQPAESGVDIVHETPDAFFQPDLF